VGTSDVDRCECKDGDDADTDPEEEASHADAGSTPNVEDCAMIPAVQQWISSVRIRLVQSGSS
jgi:hypothetical protein